MFVLATLPEIHTELVTKQAKCDEMQKTLEEKREFMVKCSREQEESLRELVQQRRETTAN